MKIIFAASAGGHWEEIMSLRELAEKHDIVYVTEKSEQTKSLHSEHLYVFPVINRRERFFMIHFLKLFFNARRIVRKEKPDVIISTGALMALEC